MSDFGEWHERHLAQGKPPAPFKMEDRVVVDSPAVDGGFSIYGVGVVVSVEYIEDPADPYSPWAVSVIFDGDDQPMLFNSREIRLHTAPRSPGILARLDDAGTTIYDKVKAEQEQATRFADDVEAWLKAKTAGGAR